ncbi:MAG: stage II sporulation protein M [Kiritimatiellaeota bacterium]|nr:stage II sporulation protein M [Kiritimatiellota bacterium]
MIVDLQRFLNRNEPQWRALEDVLKRIEQDPGTPLGIADITRLHALYEHASNNLAELNSAVSNPEVRKYVETLVMRAYSEVYSQRARATRFSPLRWLLQTFPQTFRKHAGFFALACAITLGGILFGGGAILADPPSREVLMPFGHDKIDPRKRVAEEEKHSLDKTRGRHAFSAHLLQNNARVSVFTFASGITYGIVSGILLFYNGAILGAISTDYVMAGQGRFLAAWLLPHGSVEIPCILFAGQAALLLGAVMFGRRSNLRLGLRIRAVLPDLVTLIGGAVVLLAWAALVESFLSQYHSPRIYILKIAFGLVEAVLLALFLAYGGRGKTT